MSVAIKTKWLPNLSGRKFKKAPGTETIVHLFWFCDRIFHLWSALANWIWLVIETEIEFSLESVLLGYTNCMPCKNAINCIILEVTGTFHYTGKSKMPVGKSNGSHHSVWEDSEIWAVI